MTFEYGFWLPVIIDPGCIGNRCDENKMLLLIICLSVPPFTQDLYVDRPLPYLIGSQLFMETDDVGLGDLSSEGEFDIILTTGLLFHKYFSCTIKLICISPDTLSRGLQQSKPHETTTLNQMNLQPLSYFF